MVPCTIEGDRQIWLIDTPGFDDTYRTDADVLREIANSLAGTYVKKIQLSGIIYLHRISDTRVGNAATRNLRMFKKLCGKDGLASVVLATTMWSDGSNREVERARENELQNGLDFWKTMIQLGSKVFRHDKGRRTAAEIIKYLINKQRRVVLDIQTEMIDENRTLADTGAGAEVVSDLERNTEMWTRTLESLKQELMEAMSKRDEESKKESEELKIEIAHYREKLEREAKSWQKLQANYDQLQMQMKEQHDEEIRKLTCNLEATKAMLSDAQRHGERLQQKEQELEKLNTRIRSLRVKNYRWPLLLRT